MVESENQSKSTGPPSNTAPDLGLWLASVLSIAPRSGFEPAGSGRKRPYKSELSPRSLDPRPISGEKSNSLKLLVLLETNGLSTASMLWVPQSTVPLMIKISASPPATFE